MPGRINAISLTLAPVSTNLAAAAASPMAIASATLRGAPMVNGCEPAISPTAIAAIAIVTASGGSAGRPYHATDRFRTIVPTPSRTETASDDSTPHRDATGHA